MRSKAALNVAAAAALSLPEPAASDPLCQLVNMPRRKLLALGAVALGLTACGGGGGGDGGGGGSGGGDDPAPSASLSLTSSTPSDGAVDVVRDAPVQLQFSESVIGSGIATLQGPRGEVAVEATVDGNEVTLLPQRRLGFGEHYTVRISSAARGVGGGSFSGTNPSFTTVERNASMALGAHVIDSYVRRRFADPATEPFDPLPVLYDSGMEWLRVAVTTWSFPELRATS
jgi:hypothetical protein